MDCAYVDLGHRSRVTPSTVPSALILMAWGTCLLNACGIRPHTFKFDSENAFVVVFLQQRGYFTLCGLFVCLFCFGGGSQAHWVDEDDVTRLSSSVSFLCVGTAEVWGNKSSTPGSGNRLYKALYLISHWTPRGFLLLFLCFWFGILRPRLTK